MITCACTTFRDTLDVPIPIWRFVSHWKFREFVVSWIDYPPSSHVELLFVGLFIHNSHWVNHGGVTLKGQNKKWATVTLVCFKKNDKRKKNMMNGRE